MLLQQSYRLFSPIYDLFVRAATQSVRMRSLSRLPQDGRLKILISGAGTGLDFPHLSHNHEYMALDVTRAMLSRAVPKIGERNIVLVQGDSMQLPFADASFDVVVLHLILAVVPDSQRCLKEASRVLKPGGQILLLDKFLRRGERAWFRRLLGLFTSGVITRMNVIFEEVLDTTTELQLVSDRPALAGGWFRLIELRKSKA